MNHTTVEIEDGKSQPEDVKAAVLSEYTHGEISTDHLSGTFDFSEGDTGVIVHQDHFDLALSTGTFENRDDGPDIYIYQKLSPEQAREIAEALNSAADRQEARLEQIDNESEEREFRRMQDLVGGSLVVQKARKALWGER